MNPDRLSMSGADTINDDVTMASSAGVLLANRYRVVNQLGQGGMGSVWLAEDTKLDGRKVAVKMLPSILVNNKRAYAQVKAEALVSLKLTHPNIVAVRAFEEECGSPFLVMDYIDGQTLDDYLAEKGTLTEEETLRFLKPVAAALDYAHEQGVVHRDVKPGNVMIDKAGHPYVLDFGIAREVQETMTRVTGKFSSGTLMYMSPEQLHGATPKPAQDVYSFAAMAYECLTGHPPFSRGQVEYQIEHDAPEPLGLQFAHCGAGVMAGLAKVPEARPAACGAVLEAKSWQGADGRASASRALIVAVLLGVLTLAGFAGWWVWKGQREADVARQVEIARQEEACRLEDEKRLAEEKRQAEEKRIAEKNQIAEEKRKVEEAKAAIARTREDADRRRQEEISKLTTMRTKIAVRGTADEGGFEKVASSRSKRDGFEAHLAEIGKRRATVEDVQNQKALAPEKGAGGPLGPKVGDIRTIALPGGATMEMVWCPPGSFMMGSPETEDDRCSDETRHRVTLKQGFWMGKYEVTQAQWESVMGENPSSFKGADRPVEWVSWDDCQAFIQKVNSGGQVTVALPTEAQWEYACRAGTTTPFSFGLSLNGDKANCDGNYPYGKTAKGYHRKETTSVGSYAPNAWGLYDMHGNVFEWCVDRYGKYGGDATNSTGATSGPYRVARGGGWDSYAVCCRSSSRSRYLPGLRDFYLGFRLVCFSEE